MVDWDKLTKEDVRINYVNGWETPSRLDRIDTPGGFTVGWSCRGVGFGELTIKWNGKTFEADTEDMDKQFCSLVLLRLLDEIFLTIKPEEETKSD